MFIIDSIVEVGDFAGIFVSALVSSIEYPGWLK